MADKNLDTRFTTRIARAELQVFRKAAKLDRRSVADAVRLAMELYVEKVFKDRGRTPPSISEEASDEQVERSDRLSEVPGKDGKTPRDPEA